MEHDKDFYFMMTIHDSLNALTHMLGDILNESFPIDKHIAMKLCFEKAEKSRCSILDYLMEKQKKKENE